MGYGGNLMWTCVAKEKYEREKKKIIFISPRGIMNDDVWKFNPYIETKLNSRTRRSCTILKTPNIMPERFENNKWNINQHTIISRCKYFGIEDPKIKCELFFSNEEKKKIENIVKDLPKDFLLLEPNSKKSWTVNKQYPLNKWQKIVDRISKEIPIVQCSIPGEKILDNVIDVSKKISNFREACLLAKYAKLFVSSEGGLMHGCNAVGTKCVIIFCPMFDPTFTKYDNIDDIWIKSNDHYNCFKEGRCDECIKIMQNHNEEEVIDKIIKNI